MHKQKSSVKKTLVTNACLAAIIALVYIVTFAPMGGLLPGAGPALKGSTGEEVVGLQIAVDEKTDVAAYLDALDRYDAKGTFFFRERQTEVMAPVMKNVMRRGHGIGYISGSTRPSALYIGGGYSIPVMNCSEGSVVQQVSPSIDISRLSKRSGWHAALADALASDMFIYIRADNNFSDFEKVVQIVLDKGYTILKVNEML